MARHIRDHVADHLHDETRFALSCVANSYVVHRLLALLH